MPVWQHTWLYQNIKTRVYWWNAHRFTIRAGITDVQLQLQTWNMYYRMFTQMYYYRNIQGHIAIAGYMAVLANQHPWQYRTGAHKDVHTSAALVSDVIELHNTLHLSVWMQTMSCCCSLSRRTFISKTARGCSCTALSMPELQQQRTLFLSILLHFYFFSLPFFLS